MVARFRILGGVEVLVDGEPLDVGHPKQRGVLGVLLTQANTPVTTDQLLDRVWGDHPPQRGRETLHSYLARLRTALRAAEGEVHLHRRAGGYQLDADDNRIDLHQFHRLLAQARHTADDDQAADLFEQALALCRGTLLPELDTHWVISLRATLDQQRWAAELHHVDAALRLGRQAELLPTLFERTQRHPLDERVAGHLMLALYRSGRQADALDQYRQLRIRLANDLGSDPGPHLQQLHQQILTADPDLTTPADTATASAVPRQLPPAPRLFTGRTAELATLTTALDQGATVVIWALAGTGGIGKTWLGLHWAHQNLHRFPDGQLFVDLRGFSPDGQHLAPEAVTRGFLSALGVEPAQIPPDPHALTACYRNRLAGRRMLIVLDNAVDVDQVTPLLPGSPTCTVLVTSRRRLAGLAALHSAELLDLDVLPEPDAYNILAHHLGPQRLAAEPAAVTDLLAVCAGLPLAVRIVATRAAHHLTFPLAVLVDELRDATTRLDGLDAGDLHSNLRAVLSWSARTLSPRATSLFGLLGIAPGPDIGLPAAAALAGQPAGQVRLVLRELEHASLIQQHLPDRYRMHDLVRLYAAGAAHHDIATDVRKSALRRVIDFYIHTAYTADRLLEPHRLPISLDPPAPGVQPQPLADYPAALAWFDTEHSVLLAAQQTATSHAWHTAVWRLAWTLNTFHVWRGHRHDRLTVWQTALDSATHLPGPIPRIHAHRALGHAYTALGHHDDAIGHLHQALALAEEHRDTGQQTHTHRVLGLAWEGQGDLRQALEHATRALDLVRTLDQPVEEADALNAAGWLTARLGESDMARTYCEAALALHQRHHNRAGEADTLDSLAYVAHHSGHHQQAIGYYQQALALVRALGNSHQTAVVLDRLGHPYVALGDHEQARVVWREAMVLYQNQSHDIEATRIQRQLDDLGNGCGARPCRASSGR